MLIPVAEAYNFIDLGSDFSSNTLAISGDLFSDFGTLVTVIVGTVLAITILGFLLNAFKHH